MLIESCVTKITDPRKATNQIYSLDSLILIIFSAVISGYDSIDSMVEFAKLKKDWLNKWTDLKTVPCAETLRYFLCTVNPNELAQCFTEFVRINQLDSTGDNIAIDGKTMRGTKSKASEAIHVISAWSHEHGITLAALESKGKRNEIKTIPDIIDVLAVKKAVISTDAMGCQTAIASKIIESGNDYVLQLKDNQKSMLEDVKAYFHKVNREDFSNTKYSVFEEIDKAHGRIEIRKYTQFELTDWIDNLSSWKSLTSAIQVERTRIVGEKETQEISWYLSSMGVDAQAAAKSVRSHWGVENPLHWCLDVVFKEDSYELYSAHGPLNMAIIKRFCMNLLKQDTKIKRLKHKVMAASVDDSYREKVLLG